MVEKVGGQDPTCLSPFVYFESFCRGKGATVMEGGRVAETYQLRGVLQPNPRQLAVLPSCCLLKVMNIAETCDQS